MISRGLLVKSLAVAICSGLVFVSGTSVVSAAAGGNTYSDPYTEVSANGTTSTSDCVGASAFDWILYKVDGQSVPTLVHNVKPGTSVSVSFALKAQCDNTQVGVAAYEAKSDHGNTQPFVWQTLVGHQDGTFTAGGTHNVSVTVPDCYFQVDFYTGSAANPGDSYASSGRLVSTDVGGTTECGSGSSTTSTTVRPTTTTTTQPGTNLPTEYKCPAKLADRITDYWVEVNGNKYTKLANIKSGDTVTVHFTLKQGCKTELTLASYEAQSLDSSPSGVLSQTLFDHETKWFTPGTYSLTADVPECMYQVDFVEGKAIEKFGPVGTNNYYAGRILDTALGGTEKCNSTTTTTSPGVTTTTIQGGSTTSTTLPTTTTSILGGSTSTTSTTVPDATTTTIEGGVTTTTAPDVQAEETTTTVAPGVTSTTTPVVAGEVTTTTTPSVQAATEAKTNGQSSGEVEAANLARTGINAWSFVALGALFLTAGVFFVSASRRMAVK